MSTIQSIELIQLANSLYKRGFNDTEVSVQLREKGAAESILYDIIQQVKKLRLSRKRKSGFICCGIGVFLLVFGCLFSLFLYQNGGNIRLAMYGLTSLGVIFTLKGLADLMGW